MGRHRAQRPRAHGARPLDACSPRRTDCPRTTWSPCSRRRPPAAAACGSGMRGGGIAEVGGRPRRRVVEPRRAACRTTTRCRSPRSACATGGARCGPARAPASCAAASSAGGAWRRLDSVSGPPHAERHGALDRPGQDRPRLPRHAARRRAPQRARPAGGGVRSGGVRPRRRPAERHARTGASCATRSAGSGSPRPAASRCSTPRARPRSRRRPRRWCSSERRRRDQRDADRTGRLARRAGARRQARVRALDAAPRGRGALPHAARSATTRSPRPGSDEPHKRLHEPAAGRLPSSASRRATRPSRVSPVELAFTLRAAPWLQPWAIALEALATLAAAVALLRFRERSLRRQAAGLEVARRRAHPPALGGERAARGAERHRPAHGLPNRRRLETHAAEESGAAARGAARASPSSCSTSTTSSTTTTRSATSPATSA